MWIIRPKNVAQPLGVTGPGDGLALRKGSEGRGGVVSRTCNISNLCSDKATTRLGKRAVLESSVCSHGLSQRQVHHNNPNWELLCAFSTSRSALDTFTLYASFHSQKIPKRWELLTTL